MGENSNPMKTILLSFIFWVSLVTLPLWGGDGGGLLPLWGGQSEMGALLATTGDLSPQRSAEGYEGGPEYLPEDSILIERLLREAQTSRGEMERTLWFGRQLLGRPYVAHTLENGTEEHLIVNTRGLDCTTFVETVCALSLCDQHRQTSFADFWQWLKKLRYRQGKIDDYTSRLHYFTQWGEDNEQMGLVENILEREICNC